jgi:hypothetical protein
VTHDAWFCSECLLVCDLDPHARCAFCGSDSLTPAFWQSLALEARIGITYAVKDSSRPPRRSPGRHSLAAAHTHRGGV